MVIGNSYICHKVFNYKNAGVTHQGTSVSGWLSDRLQQPRHEKQLYINIVWCITECI